MSPQRLWMDEIVSVGLVPKGDNPGAKVTVWKRAPDRDDAHARLDAAIAKADRLLEAKRRRTDGRSSTYMQEGSTMSSAEDVAKAGLDANATINDLARKMCEDDPSLTLPVARSQVRKAHPDLAKAEREGYDPALAEARKRTQEAMEAEQRAVRRAAARQQGQDAGPTVKELIGKAMDRRARWMQTQPAHFASDLRKIKAALWRTEIGSQLRKLSNGEAGKRPVDRIVKSDELDEDAAHALTVAKRWAAGDE